MKEVKRREERRSEGGTEEIKGEMDNDGQQNFLDSMLLYRSCVAVELQLLSVDIEKEALQHYTHHCPHSPSP